MEGFDSVALGVISICPQGPQRRNITAMKTYNDIFQEIGQLFQIVQINWREIPTILWEGNSGFAERFRWGGMDNWAE